MKLEIKCKCCKGTGKIKITSKNLYKDLGEPSEEFFYTYKELAGNKIVKTCPSCNGSPSKLSKEGKELLAFLCKHTNIELNDIELT